MPGKSGETGIRTLGTLAGTPVFKTGRGGFLLMEMKRSVPVLTGRSAFYLERSLRSANDRHNSRELLDGPEFWLRGLADEAPEICFEIASAVFRDYFNPDLRDILADALEDAGDPFCEIQRDAAKQIRKAELYVSQMTDMRRF